MVDACKQKYQNADKWGRIQLASDIVTAWRSQYPTGRFLTKSEPHKEDSRWHDIGNRAAVRKVSRLLGEKRDLPVMSLQSSGPWQHQAGYANEKAFPGLDSNMSLTQQMFWNYRICSGQRAPNPGQSVLPEAGDHDWEEERNNELCKKWPILNKHAMEEQLRKKRRRLSKQFLAKLDIPSTEQPFPVTTTGSSVISNDRVDRGETETYKKSLMNDSLGSFSESSSGERFCQGNNAESRQDTFHTLMIDKPLEQELRNRRRI